MASLVLIICTGVSHYSDVIMDMMASEITSLTFVYSTVCSGTDQRKHRNSASLAFVRGINRWLVNSLHKGSGTRKMSPFDGVIMHSLALSHWYHVSVAGDVLMCSTMNFRQRMAWLAVSLYLGATCWIMYYIFEISDSYNVFALDHVDKFHKPSESGAQSWSLWTLFQHVMDIPLPVWLLIAFLPYLQVFAMLLACTKPQPRFSMAYLWPIYIVLWCQNRWMPSNESSHRKALNSMVPNGHVLIDTWFPGLSLSASLWWSGPCFNVKTIFPAITCIPL